MLRLTLAALVAALPAAAAAQQMVCAPYPRVVESLGGTFGELPRFRALDKRGGLMMALANAKTTTWTMIVVRPDGVACVVGAGEGWTEMQTPEKKDDPT